MTGRKENDNVHIDMYMMFETCINPNLVISNYTIIGQDWVITQNQSMYVEETLFKMRF